MKNTASPILPSDEDQLLNPVEAGKLLGRSAGWMVEHVSKLEPRVPCVRFGRYIQFRRSDLRSFVEQHARNAD